jgi:hypothetical protein
MMGPLAAAARCPLSHYRLNMTLIASGAEALAKPCATPLASKE